MLTICGGNINIFFVTISDILLSNLPINLFKVKLLMFINNQSEKTSPISLDIRERDIFIASMSLSHPMNLLFNLLAATAVVPDSIKGSTKL